jgi:hypothetical protein
VAVHDSREAERLQRHHVQVCQQIERPVGEAQAAKRPAPE